MRTSTAEAKDDDLVARLGGLKAHDARKDDGLRRREERLRAQRASRRDVVAIARGLIGLPLAEEADERAAVDADTEAADAEAADGARDARAPRRVAMQCEAADTTAQPAGDRVPPAKHAYADALMLPEWMSELPADLARAWLVMPRPAGQRCLVVSVGGQTTARRRNGAIIARFPSALPGGRRATDGRGGASAFCVLDCVFDAAQKCYHVLDVMVWKGYMLYDCHAQFRLYWAHTKLDEVRAGARARTNPCVFAAVPYRECGAASVRALYESEWPFARDGLLFVHRETVYEPGSTPLLLLWTDARCSARFFDFGSEGMERVLQRSPAKRESWKECERALTFEQLEGALLAAGRSGGNGDADEDDLMEDSQGF